MAVEQEDKGQMEFRGASAPSWEKSYTLSLSRFREEVPGASEISALTAPPTRTFSLRLACSTPLKNKIEIPRAHFSIFALDLAVLALELARRRVPRTPRASILERETAVFSRFCCSASIRCAKRPTSKKHRKNQYETHFGPAVHRTQID